jgi:ferredoxin-nitrite reductase
VTTRANLQLRGLTLEDSGPLIEGLQQRGLSSFQSGMDSVRNLTGSPIAGLDPHEQLDVRPLIRELNAALHGPQGEGNPEFANLPRKLNVAVSPSRDDFPHCHINDVGFEATSARCAESGQVLFNVVVGGYFSIKRNVTSIPLGCAVREDELVDFTVALLRLFRDKGNRTDRQKARLMWLVEDMGEQAFREALAERMGLAGGLRPPVEHAHAHNGNGSSDALWERRDLLGVHDQKQDGMCWVGVCVPAGRLSASEMKALADAAEKHGDGTLRLTCEENVIIPNVAKAQVDALLAEPCFDPSTGSKLQVFPGKLLRGMVSCTGAQFCGLALIETKNRALDIVQKLEAQLDLPRTVRVHWTGCPNSCGQVQVADIGLMGAPARHEGKAVEGVRIFVGGKIGEGAALATELEAGVPCVESVLLPKLRALMVERFGARVKEGVVIPEEEAVAAAA